MRILISHGLSLALLYLPSFLLPFQDDSNSSLLNNYVLGAQLDHRPVNNLQKPVNISFWHNQSLVLLGPPPPQLLKLSCQPCFGQTENRGTIWKTTLTLFFENFCEERILS